MRLWVVAALVALGLVGPAGATSRPLSPPLRDVGDALVPLPATRFQQQEGVVAAARYVAFTGLDGRLRAWDSRRRRLAAQVAPPAGGVCIPRAGRHDEFVVYCPTGDGTRPFLFSVARGSVEPIVLPPPFEGWYVADVGRRWFELRSGPEQYFLDRVTGERRRGGHLDEPGYILLNRDLDDPDLGPWLRRQELRSRRGLVYWKGPRGRLIRIGPEGNRVTASFTYGRFATWLDDRFAAAFDTVARRRYRWRLRRVPAGLYLPHTRYAALFVVGPRPRRVADDEPVPMVPARVLAARWRR